MRLLLASDVPVLPIAHAVGVTEDLVWNDGHAVLWTEDGPSELWRVIHQVRDPIMGLMQMIGGFSLRRAEFMLLPAGGVGAQKSQISFPRYELVLHGSGRAVVGEEQVIYEIGQLWSWKGAEVTRINDGDDELLLLVAEIECG